MYEELVKQVDEFRDYDLKRMALRWLKKVPEEDWEQFKPGRGADFELFNEISTFARKYFLQLADGIDDMSPDEITALAKEIRKRKNRKIVD